MYHGNTDLSGYAVLSKLEEAFDRDFLYYFNSQEEERNERSEKLAQSMIEKMPVGNNIFEDIEELS